MINLLKAGSIEKASVHFNKGMAVLKDICRICLQEVDYQELQEIHLPKLKNLITSRPLLNFSFIEKWQVELFRNHLICSTCIQNFRTMLTVYRLAYKVNAAILNEKNKLQLSKVNLKRLVKFNHIEGDFVVCRLCLESTREIAIYLYDNSKNILPVEYIEKMLRHTKVYTNFKRTINPILCNLCWQHIQITYAFSKHLEVVTEKMVYYQALIEKMYIDREDLQDVLHMWDQLGIVNIKTEIDAIIKKEIKEDRKPELKDAVKNLGKTPLKKNVANMKPDYSFYDDHNYFRRDADVSGISDNKLGENMRSLERKTETTKDSVKESFHDMPKLKPNFESNIDNKSGSNRRLQGKIRIEEHKKREKLGFTINNEQERSVTGKNTETLKVATKKHKLKETAQNKLEKKQKETKDRTRRYEKAFEIMENKQEEENNTVYKQQFRSIKKYDGVTWTENTKNKEQINGIVHKEKNVVSKRKNKRNSFKNIEHLEIPTMERLRPRTRLSAKKEFINDPFSQNLLVLSREEIIKKKPQKRKPYTSFPKHTSTPKISKNTNVSNPASENSTSKSNANIEYTFESINLDDEVHVKKEVIEEEELQIKREILSECESDDLFTENTDRNTNDIEGFDEECPHLESFIKPEPPDESFDIDMDEEGPPELEFQGPCHSVPVPISCFKIQNTFTVNEKRNLIDTVDEKRNLLNLFDDKPLLVKSTVDDTRSATEEKGSSLTPILVEQTSFQMPQSDLSKANNEKLKQKSPLIKVKGVLFKKVITPKTLERERYPKFIKDLVINITKSNEKATLTFEKKQKKTENVVSKDDEVESQINTSATRPVLNTMLNIYESYYKQNIRPKLPYFCKMCDFSSKNYQGVINHLAVHINNSLPIHKCRICSFDSTRKEVLTNHMIRVHNFTRKKTTYFCDFCRSTIFSHKKSCLDCHKVFHPGCFNKDLQLSKFDCQHQSITNMKFIKAADSKNTTLPSCCEVCQKHLLLRFFCKKCNKYMHSNCFVKHYTKGGLDCNVLPFVTCKGKKGRARTRTPGTVPVTSKEAKQEMLDAS